MKKSHRYILFGICIFFIIGHIFPWIGEQWPFNTNFRIRGSFLIGMFLIMAVELADAEWDKWKHKSPQFIGDNLTSSITGSPKDTERKGKWTATRLGGIMWAEFGHAGSECTAITPEIAIDNKIGAGTFAHAQFEKLPKENLPNPVKEMVEKNDMPDPYYLATAPSEVELQNTSYIDWKSQWKQENRGQSTIKSLRKDSFKLIKQIQDMKDLAASSKMKGKVQKLEEKMDSIGSSEEE